MSSKVLLHVPCDGCGHKSYSKFYTPPTGLRRQIEVKEYKGLMLCQPCLDKRQNMTYDGLRQASMFGDGG